MAMTELHHEQLVNNTFLDPSTHSIFQCLRATRYCSAETHKGQLPTFTELAAETPLRNDIRYMTLAMGTHSCLSASLSVCLGMACEE